MMTYEQFTELKEILDKLDINYTDGNFYEKTPNGEFICGHWLEIREQMFETDELSQNDLEYNGLTNSIE